MSQLRTVIATAFLLASSLARALPAPAPEQVFKLEPYRKSFGLHGSINGVPGFFAFDSAGGITLLSPGYAARVGCKSWGRIVGFQMMGDRLETPRCDGLTAVLDGNTVPIPVANVLDVAPLFAKDATPIEGSIALDLFDGKAVTLDFPGHRLIVESPTSLAARVRGLEPLPMAITREAQGRALAVNLVVPTARGPLRMELDSGNGGTLLVSKPYAALFGLDPDAKQPQDGDFEVAPGLRAKGMSFTPDMILDGNLGMPFLRDKVVTMDLKEQKLWIVIPSGQVSSGRAPTTKK